LYDIGIGESPHVPAALILVRTLFRDPGEALQHIFYGINPSNEMLESDKRLTMPIAECRNWGKRAYISSIVNPACLK
jgi:hypothetical protein